MSTITSTKCDACCKLGEGDRWQLPAVWIAIEIKGGGTWASSTTKHACSKECAARIFLALAEESGGIPRAADPVLLTQGPYR